MQNSIRGLIDEIFKLRIPRHVSGLGHAAHSNDNVSTSFLFLTGVDTFPVIQGDRYRPQLTVYEGVIDANDVNLHIVMKARRMSFPFL